MVLREKEKAKIRAMQMDNFWNTLAIRRIDLVLNAWIGVV